jgi:hypothetical protein
VRAQVILISSGTVMQQTTGSLGEWEFFSNITKAAGEGLDEWVDEQETLAECAAKMLLTN